MIPSHDQTDRLSNTSQTDRNTHKLRDGNELYLQIQPNGKKYWRYDFRYLGKRKILAQGSYSCVSLKQARIALFAANERLEQGIDPSFQKQLHKHVSNDLSFDAVAKEWIATNDDWSDSHSHTIELLRSKFMLEVLYIAL